MLRNEGGIETFLDEGKLREYAPRRHELKEWIFFFLHRKKTIKETLGHQKERTIERLKIKYIYFPYVLSNLDSV